MIHAYECQQKGTTDENKTRLIIIPANGYTQITAKLMNSKDHLLLVPWFAVNTPIFLNMLIATFITKGTTCCAPVIALISIDWALQLDAIPAIRKVREVSNSQV